MQGFESGCLLIGGFDPTGGAGILADYETCLNMGVSPHTVLSADTIQNNRHFYAVNWMNAEWMKEQLRLILKDYKIDFVKIGLIENPAVLFALTELLFQANHEVKIIWDTVGSSSSGFSFYKWRLRDVESFFQRFYLITPNKKEFEILCNGLSDKSAIDFITANTNLLLKAIVQNETAVTDHMFFDGHQHIHNSPLKAEHHNIRGTGCRLASGIMAGMAKGKDLQEAYKISKKALENYIENVLHHLHHPSTT